MEMLLDINTISRRLSGLYVFFSLSTFLCWSFQTSDLQMMANSDVTEQMMDVSSKLSFMGEEVDPDHFRLLLVENATRSAMIGARNYIYNISLDNLAQHHKIEWPSSSTDIGTCKAKGKTEEECQNYIRTIIRKDNDQLMICGTNAFKPWCRNYEHSPILSDGYRMHSDGNGIAICPFDPKHNSTSIFTVHNGQGSLYSATMADLNARDALIYRMPIRTEQHDSQWLNDPNFVNSFDYGDKVYFFFRETAVEYINCGKTTYSRIGRVCKSDQGGASMILTNTWTSFFKSRLNCSIPGHFPFYFDEIQSTTELGQGNHMPTIVMDDKTDMIYAVFNTPETSIHGSAVCAYRMSDIVASFEGRFKAQSSPHSAWLPVPENIVPEPHPAKYCANDSTVISAPDLNFIKSHTLMDQAVPAAGGKPLFMQASFDYRFTQIAIDWHVRAANGKYYDVIFVGTDNGRVLKIVNTGLGDEVKSVLIENIQVFSDGGPILDLHVHESAAGGNDEKRLLVVGRDDIVSLALHRCHLQEECGDCVALQDPYCSWNPDVDRCQAHQLAGHQQIETGTHSHCNADGSPDQPHTGGHTSRGVGRTTPSGHHTNHINEDYDFDDEGETNVISNVPEPGHVVAGSPTLEVYTETDMAIAVILTLLVAFIVGATVGFWFNTYRKRAELLYLKRNSKHHPPTETKNLNSPNPNNKVYNHLDIRVDNTSNYTASPRAPPEKQINVVINSLNKPSSKTPNSSAETRPVTPRPVTPHKKQQVYL